MRSSNQQIPHSLWQPLYLRVWRRIVEAERALWFALLHVPRELAQRAHRRAEWRALSDLSEHALKDIGAPDWVMLNAAERSETARQRRDELGGWRGV